MYQDTDRPEGADAPIDQDDPFGAYCLRCYVELHRARRVARHDRRDLELERHRARLGAILTGDAQLGKRARVLAAAAVTIGTTDVAARLDAVRAEAARRDLLSTPQRQLEAATRRRLTSGNLAELRARMRP